MKTKNTKSEPFTSIDIASLDRVQGGSDTWKDQWDGAGNTGSKKGKSIAW